MTSVIRMRHALPMGQDINAALTDLDSAIAKAVCRAARRLVVAPLHRQTHSETM